MAVPLVVDLDGTLLLSDMLYESMVHKLHVRPLDIVLFLPSLLTDGKACFKQRLAEDMDINPALLPYNVELLDFLHSEYLAGRPLVLCTGTNADLAHTIANYLGIFTKVIASTDSVNLVGKTKGESLVAQFGEGGFDYAGNDFADLAVWKHARRAIVVNASPSLVALVQRHYHVERTFAPSAPLIRTAWRSLRLHQWLKNILLFCPSIAAHLVSEPAVWGRLLLAFFAFGTCASAVYLLNDLLDLESDRRHPYKRQRPLAAGTFPIVYAILLIPILFGISMLLALLINPSFLVLLTGYFCLTTAYSFVLKRILLLDCITLAMLYTSRIIGGGLAIDIPLSFWLLTFSVFIFLSLAFVKRYTELALLAQTETPKAHGRAYLVSDLPLLLTFGVASSYTAVLVLALYLNSDTVQLLYRQPMWLWLEIPVLTFWVSWLWMQAHRGRMHDDPFLFSIRDQVSLVSGVVFMLLLATASFL